MERRLVIKQVLILAGGMALLPSCLRHKGKSTIALTHIDLDLEEEKLLEEIAETIIPTTNTPGAKSLKLHLFALKMLDDCYEKTAQDKFIQGLQQFKELLLEKYDTSFEKLSPAERESALLPLEDQQSRPDPATTFYRIFKEQLINGYLNSQYVMQKLVIYEMIPGRCNGYFPVKTA